MYYDPMISKLITWGKTREESMRFLEKAFDKYVIQGVTHNIGFGKSILANTAYWKGDYSTAFIPTFYPKGFTGDNLDAKDHRLLSLVGHFVKNHFSNRGRQVHKSQDTLFVTIEALRDQPAADYKIKKLSDQKYEVTNLSTGEFQVHSVSDFNFQYNSLINFNLDGNQSDLQFTSVNNDGIRFKFNFKGNAIDLAIYDENQYQYKKYMPKPKKVDHAKNIISPMPGAIVSVSVKPGDKVVEGQELLVMEAMKMQNIIKSEVEGEVEAVFIKAGGSVAVDEILIKFK